MKADNLNTPCCTNCSTRLKFSNFVKFPQLSWDIYKCHACGRIYIYDPIYLPVIRNWMIYPEHIMAYKDQFGDIEHLNAYVNKVWTFLLEMKTGTRFPIEKNVVYENRLLFRYIVEMYQQETGDYSIQFNIDYEILRKR